MIILTIDTDWAPDNATTAVLERIRKLGIKASVFFSTAPPVPLWEKIEAGCHPDLSNRLIKSDIWDAAQTFPAQATPAYESSVRDFETAVLNSYKKLMPQADLIRTHRFYWHSDLPKVYKAAGFTLDSSMILPYHPHISGFRTGSVLRFPVWASDHLHLARKFPLDVLKMPGFDSPGLKIFCFHVAYLYLNTSSLADFNMVQMRELRPPQTKKAGIRDLFELLAERIYKTGEAYHIKEIPEEFVLNNSKV